MRSFGCAFGATGRRSTHHRIAHTRHDRLHVGEVAVDDAGDSDNVRDALHTLAQDVIGDPEGLEKAGVLSDGEQLLVGNHDGGIHRIHQLRDSALSLLHPALAFKGERLGNDGHGQRAHLTGERGDDRRRSSAGAASQAGGDENHVGAFQGFDDFV